MSFTPDFTAAQTIGLPSILNLTDTSIGSDVAITQRRVLIQKSDNTYLVPTGTTTNYVAWAIANASIGINVLNQDYALNITGQWLNVSDTVLYTKTILFDFTLDIMQFLVGLTMNQIAPPIVNYNASNDNNYWTNKFMLYVQKLDADSAVSISGNIYASQSALDRGDYMINNQNLFF